MGNIERGQTDWQPRSLLRKLSATDPSGASDRLIAQQDEIRTLRDQLAGAVEALREIKRATGTSTEAWRIADRALEAIDADPTTNRGQYDEHQSCVESALVCSIHGTVSGFLSAPRYAREPRDPRGTGERWCSKCGRGLVPRASR